MRQSTLAPLTVPRNSTEREESETYTEEHLQLYSEVRPNLSAAAVIHSDAIPPQMFLHQHSTLELMREC